MAIQRTFSIIKPDATRRNLTGKIIAKFEDAGLRIVGSAYQYPVGLHAPELPPPDSIEAYLNTCVVAEKPLQ